MIIARDEARGLCQVLMSKPGRQAVVTMQTQDLEQFTGGRGVTTDRAGMSVAVDNTVAVSGSAIEVSLPPTLECWSYCVGGVQISALRGVHQVLLELRHFLTVSTSSRWCRLTEPKCWAPTGRGCLSKQERMTSTEACSMLRRKMWRYYRRREGAPRRRVCGLLYMVSSSWVALDGFPLRMQKFSRQKQA